MPGGGVVVVVVEGKVIETGVTCEVYVLECVFWELMAVWCTVDYGINYSLAAMRSIKASPTFKYFFLNTDCLNT